VAANPQPAPLDHPVVAIRIAGTVPQMEFWQSSQRFRALIGGVGSGKTRAGAIECLRQPPGSLGMVVAPTYKMLAQATYPGLLEVIQPLLQAGAPALPYGDDAPPNLVESFNKSDWVLKLKTGAKILLRSGEDPDYLRGPSLGWWWLDEGAMCVEAVLLQLLARLRVAPERGWVTTTPRGFNWLYRRFVSEGGPEYKLIYAPTN
jgi:phage terminase large subunit-like protein